MALNINSAETERLARALARERGTTVTRAVIDALDEALRRTRRRCAALPDLDTRTADEILGYDDRGGFS